jgi:hypothetical protein
MLALTRVGTPHWLRKDREDNVHLGPIRCYPYAMRLRQDNTAQGSDGRYGAYRLDTAWQDACTILPTMGWDPWWRPWLRGHTDQRKPWPWRLGPWPLAPHANRVVDDPELATNPYTTPQETRRRWWRPWRRPRHIGRLANHHHAYSTTMASTVASRLILPRRGHKTMMTNTSRCAPQDGVACKPS